MGEKTEGAIQIVEVRCFRKWDAELGEENEILKEATAYFVKHQR